MAELQNEYEDNRHDECEDILDEKGDELPKRCEDKYKDIENFELYELTQCLAYEMAIRNNEVQKIIKELDDLTLSMKPLLIGFNADNASKIALIGQKVVQLQMTLEEDYYVVYDAKKIFLPEQDETIQSINYHEPDGEINNLCNSILHEHQEDGDESYRSNCIVEDGYAAFQGGYTGSLDADVNKIIPNFKRPLRVYNRILVDLNLSLPKPELVAFIEKIKDDYDSKNSIKNVDELMNQKVREYSKNLRDMTPKQWADCFFIYDYYKASSDKNKTTTLQAVQEHLTVYNGVKVRKSDKQIRRDRNKNDNSVYEIIPYQKYRESNPIEFINNKPYDKLYDKNFKDHRPSYGDGTIEERLEYMTLLIDNLEYKTFVFK